MFKFSWKKISLLFVLSLSLILVACGEGNDNGATGDEEGNGNLGETNIELVYVEWDSEVASTHVVAKVLEEQGYNVVTTPIDNAIMWEAVASGDADGMVAAWLPATHGDLYEEYQDQIDQLGVNLEGAKIGLVVPEYMEDVNTIADLNDFTDDFNGTITAIEPGAGVVQAAERSVDEYGLEGWTVETSSSGAMVTALGQAYSNEEPIVVTGWTPHWKFAEYDLKYLEDPDNVFGEAETIETMVRLGLEEDSPLAYQILDNFHWEATDMEEVMLDISEGTSAEEAAETWIEANRDKVDEWIADAE
ncbi:glycine betaine ABC transporter substrate-binding protein [Amphibacillus sp. MSJ-3]|uniref:glycine betaine ABC transporter substrate-binding protein n=1 Tax=Amphibacillus sp. MSJ-3 TaxID=2841505 RepID=UPI001C0EEA90|nr:glycine betaine ABC transporter substrate-binding protein [Amphibacillus sp. MSJ-3]MBU5594004.1 glycine betaine ABC transporter substrate-binding protein [Amphibacillus sp. MSJ-3]